MPIPGAGEIRMTPRAGDRALFRVALTYVGAVVGGGFATGREILQFFGVYGPAGLLGLGVAGVLFAAYGAWFLELVAARRIGGHMQLFDLVAPPLVPVLDLITVLFLFCGLGVMISGLGLLLTQLGLGIVPALLAAGLMVVTSLWWDVRGLLWVNTTLMLFLCLTLAGLLSLYQIRGWLTAVLPEALPHTAGGSWVWAAILYVAYNSFLAAIVLSSLGPELPSPLPAWLEGAVGGAFLWLLATAVMLLISAQYPDSYADPLPMMLVAVRTGPIFGHLYTAALGGAILTTAMANGHGLSSRLSRSGRIPYRAVLVVAVAASLPVATYGFARLVAVLYPLMGLVALPFLVILAWRGLQRSP